MASLSSWEREGGLGTAQLLWGDLLSCGLGTPQPLQGLLVEPQVAGLLGGGMGVGSVAGTGISVCW